MDTSQQLYNMSLTLNDILLSRGADEEDINMTSNLEFIRANTPSFINDNMPIFDRLIQSHGRKWCIRVLNVAPEKVSQLENEYKLAFYGNKLTAKTDDVIIVCYSASFALPKADYFILLNKYNNLSIFMHNELITNKSRHMLVPQHIKMTPFEVQEMMLNFKLTSKTNLPVILKGDYMGRHLGLRIGDVVKIVRPSRNSKDHITYRVCIAGDMADKNEFDAE